MMVNTAGDRSEEAGEVTGVSAHGKVIASEESEERELAIYRYYSFILASNIDLNGENGAKRRFPHLYNLTILSS